MEGKALSQSHLALPYAVLSSVQRVAFQTRSSKVGSKTLQAHLHAFFFFLIEETK